MATFLGYPIIDRCPDCNGAVLPHQRHELVLRKKEMSGLDMDAFFRMCKGCLKSYKAMVSDTTGHVNVDAAGNSIDYER